MPGKHPDGKIVKRSVEGVAQFLGHGGFSLKYADANSICGYFRIFAEFALIDRIKLLCGGCYITLNRLEKELGFGKSSIARWDTNSPSIDKVQKVADYFNVSLDYLVGRDDVPNRKEGF